MWNIAIGLSSSKPFPTVEAELTTLARQRDDFRRIIDPQEDDIIFELCTFLEAYDIRTAYPLLLAMMECKLDDLEWEEISNVLESYLLRRAVCDLGTKNYNRVFLSLTRNLQKSEFSGERLRALLLALTGESVVWPDDAMFRESWLRKPLYGPLNSPKLVHLFKRLNQTFMSTKSEKVTFSKPPSIEHIMPQAWTANWPLQDGSKGMDFVELFGAFEHDPRAIGSRKREIAVQTLGNLTILSTELNTAQSNLKWMQKRPEMMKHSLLPINQMLCDKQTWDETEILARGQQLFDKALTIWTR